MKIYATWHCETCEIIFEEPLESSTMSRTFLPIIECARISLESFDLKSRKTLSCEITWIKE